MIGLKIALSGLLIGCVLFSFLLVVGGVAREGGAETQKLAKILAIIMVATVLSVIGGGVVAIWTLL